MNIVNVACHDALDVFLLFQARKLANDGVEAVAFNLNFQVRNPQSLSLQLSHAYAVENVRFHVNVSNKMRNLMTLFDYLVKSRTAVFATAPMNNNPHPTAPIKRRWLDYSTIINFYVVTQPRLQ